MAPTHPNRIWWNLDGNLRKQPSRNKIIQHSPNSFHSNSKFQIHLQLEQDHIKTISNLTLSQLFPSELTLFTKTTEMEQLIRFSCKTVADILTTPKSSQNSSRKHSHQTATPNNQEFQTSMMAWDASSPSLHVCPCLERSKSYYSITKATRPLCCRPNLNKICSAQSCDGFTPPELRAASWIDPMTASTID